MLIFRDKLFAADLGIGKKIFGGFKKIVKPSEYSKAINNGLPKGMFKANHTPLVRKYPIGRTRPNEGLLAKGPHEITPAEALKRRAAIADRGPRAIEPRKPLVSKEADPLNRLSRSARERSDRLEALRKRFEAERAANKKPWPPL